MYWFCLWIGRGARVSRDCTTQHHVRVSADSGEKICRHHSVRGMTPQGSTHASRLHGLTQATEAKSGHQIASPAGLCVGTLLILKDALGHSPRKLDLGLIRLGVWRTGRHARGSLGDPSGEISC